jgi:hypothetical protein
LNDPAPFLTIPPDPRASFCTLVQKCLELKISKNDLLLFSPEAVSLMIHIAYSWRMSRISIAFCKFIVLTDSLLSYSISVRQFFEHGFPELIYLLGQELVLEDHDEVKNGAKRLYAWLVRNISIDWACDGIVSVEFVWDTLSQTIKLMQRTGSSATEVGTEFFRNRITVNTSCDY